MKCNRCKYHDPYRRWCRRKNKDVPLPTKCSCKEHIESVEACFKCVYSGKSRVYPGRLYCYRGYHIISDNDVCVYFELKT